MAQKPPRPVPPVVEVWGGVVEVAAPLVVPGVLVAPGVLVVPCDVVVVWEPSPEPPVVLVGGGGATLVVTAPPPPPADDPPLLDGEPEPDPAGVVLVVVVDVLVVDGVPLLAAVVAPDGTVSGGAPLVSVVAGPPLPQALSPAGTIKIATITPSPRERLRRDTLRPSVAGGRLLAERFHPPAAVGAIVEVLLRKLIAVIAEAQVLDCPGELGGGGRQRQQLSDDLEFLAGDAVDVTPVRFGFDDHFTAGGWRPHPVSLANPHGRRCYQRPRPAAAAAGAQAGSGRPITTKSSLTHVARRCAWVICCGHDFRFGHVECPRDRTAP